MFKEDVNNFHRIQYEIMVFSIVIAAALMIFTCGVMMNVSNRILRKKTAAMMKTNAEQTAGNIDAYLENIDYFSDMILTEAAMDYDPTVSGSEMDPVWYRGGYYIRRVNEHGIYVFALDMNKYDLSETVTPQGAYCFFVFPV